MSGAANPPGSAAPAGAAAAPAPVPEGDDRHGHQASIGLGALMLAAAAATLVDAAGLEGGSALIGAGAFPTVVALLLIAAGAALIVRSLAKLRGAPAVGPALRARLVRLAALIAALVVFAGVLPYAGFTLSSALLFTAAALLLGAPHPWRTAAYGWTLAGLLFLLFDVLIGLSLPGGPWGF
ncbi:hypothetical protein FZ103_24710 [Streptomonospora sp. PA3]|uniref:tripartite tricarboxylate transporter TctB family protein n=1 Tax=Streptomonospora sp. PA3 TaxID=2607326 RepID=UPI0012DE3B9F|nr:tripartite tricarboxylate transporter TctB family protein [Streptomonospora sp. PA3]MUL44323.1 hypothetical protein [Streptomonospora sp. PA3]